MARALIRARKLCDQADELLRKAAKYGGQVHDALESEVIDDQSGEPGGATKLVIAVPRLPSTPRPPPSESAETGLRSKAGLARGYRHGTIEH